MPDTTDTPEVPLIKKVIELLREERPGWLDQDRLPSQPVINRLLSKAQFLISEAERLPKIEVHAYQLFDSNDPLMTPGDIAERFKEAGWKRGKSRNTIADKILTILEHADAEGARVMELMTGVLLEGPPTPDPKEKFIAKIRAELDELFRRLGIHQFLPNRQALKEVLFSKIANALDSALRISDSAWRRANPEAMIASSGFMRYVCGSDTVEQYRDRKDARVRAYELFLYAAQRQILPRELTIARGGLHKTTCLTPSVPRDKPIVENYCEDFTL
ncbi:hypothetical protein KBB96_10340 [Luteolibacter ambystomatis]|uniref:Uncharacterized protein n=1 Tax=Luteolibacter ambystomatis TaxID=2824561 RepID=A0A975G4Q5_9BACT|nr:hypothetical protein [Luteolibacter ambystomatis]QUE49272.1 hypothetical protein KBB96_10340 [Luteolibacter ambystomatis]